MSTAKPMFSDPSGRIELPLDTRANATAMMAKNLTCKEILVKWTHNAAPEIDWDSLQQFKRKPSVHSSPGNDVFLKHVCLAMVFLLLVHMMHECFY